MKIFFKLLFGLFLTTTLLVPAFALAQATGPNAYYGSGPNASYGCGGEGVFKLCNPLGVENFCDLIKAILSALMVIGLPIAVILLVWAGFMFIMARGNDAKLIIARKNLLYVVIGIAVFLGAWTIASVISATIQSVSGGTINFCGK